MQVTDADVQVDDVNYLNDSVIFQSVATLAQGKPFRQITGLCLKACRLASGGTPWAEFSPALSAQKLQHAFPLSAGTDE